MGIAIRKVLAEDAYEYADCHIACWQSAYKGIIPDEYLDNMPKEKEKWAERFLKSFDELADTHLFYCAEIGDKMIGRLTIGKSRDEEKPDAGEIRAIYLLEEYWGRGYGRQLMDFALGKLKSMGYGEVVLWVLEDNIRARRFYEKAGFACDGAKKEIAIGKALADIRYTRSI